MPAVFLIGWFSHTEHHCQKRPITKSCENCGTLAGCRVGFLGRAVVFDFLFTRCSISSYLQFIFIMFKAVVSDSKMYLKLKMKLIRARRCFESLARAFFSKYPGIPHSSFLIIPHLLTVSIMFSVEIIFLNPCLKFLLCCFWTLLGNCCQSNGKLIMITLSDWNLCKCDLQFDPSHVRPRWT